MRRCAEFSRRDRTRNDEIRRRMGGEETIRGGGKGGLI
jgi:hypothetical protein